MDELHGDRAFSDAGRHTFDRSMPHVSSHKNSWRAGFQKKRFALQRPHSCVMGLARLSQQIRTGEDESIFVSLDFSGQPFSMGERADKDEERFRWEGFARFRAGVGDG